MTRTNDDRSIGDLEKVVSARLKELYPASEAGLPVAPVNLSGYRRARRLGRPVILGVAAAAVLALVAGGAIELGHRGGNSTQAPIADSAGSSPSSSPLAATAAPCATADLKVSTQPSTFGMNSEGLIFSVTNTGSSQCAVPDHATDIHGHEADGTDIAVDNITTSGRLSGTTPGPLGPGETATFALETGNPSMCSSSTNLHTFTSISLAFGPDATLKTTLSAADPLTLGCGGAGVTQVGVSSASSSAKAGTSATASTGAAVEASRALPSQVTAGSSMSYTVTLTNNSSSAVLLSPCPSYRAYLVPNPGQIAANTITGTLDCAGQTSIPAGGHVSFDLNIKAPTQTGLAKLAWWVTGATFSAETGGTVTVTQ